jgi:hypothetical protein
VNSNLFSKRLQPINQGPRADVLVKKTEDPKSGDTVPLKTAIADDFKFSVLVHIQVIKY